MKTFDSYLDEKLKDPDFKNEYETCLMAEKGGLMSIVATWKPGFGMFAGKADAQKVAEEILSIGGEGVTCEQIYEKAKGVDTELHKCLEWDDGKAADQYRIIQCGNIMRHLIIRHTEESEQPKEPIRYFYYSDRSCAYIPTVKIVKNEDEYSSLLQQALRELRIFKQKYSCLTELKEIFDLIE